MSSRRLLFSSRKGGWSSYARRRKVCVRNSYASTHLIPVVIARILSQIRTQNAPVPIEIFAQAKAKETPTDAVPKFLQAYTAHSRVGTLTKESHTGKLVDEWNKLLSDSETKPELVDMASAVSSFMAVKDEDELVCVSSSCLHTMLIN